MQLRASAATGEHGAHGMFRMAGRRVEGDAIHFFERLAYGSHRRQTSQLLRQRVHRDDVAGGIGGDDGIADAAQRGVESFALGHQLVGGLTTSRQFTTQDDHEPEKGDQGGQPRKDATACGLFVGAVGHRLTDVQELPLVTDHRVDEGPQ